VDTVRMNRDIAKATKANEKAAVKASERAVNAPAEVSTALQKIEPAITRLTAESVALAADSIKQTTQAISSADFREKYRDNVIKQKNVLAKLADTGYMPRIEKKSALIPVKGVPKVTVDA